MPHRPSDRALKEPLPTTVPTQHGWFAIFHDSKQESWWAHPVIAWRLQNLSEINEKSDSDHIVGTGITVPSTDGDDACNESNEFVCYRWMPELYNIPPDAHRNSLPSWIIQPLAEETKS